MPCHDSYTGAAPAVEHKSAATSGVASAYRYRADGSQQVVWSELGVLPLQLRRSTRLLPRRRRAPGMPGGWTWRRRRARAAYAGASCCGRASPRRSGALTRCWWRGGCRWCARCSRSRPRCSCLHRRRHSHPISRCRCSCRRRRNSRRNSHSKSIISSSSRRGSGSSCCSRRSCVPQLLLLRQRKLPRGDQRRAQQRLWEASRRCNL